MFGDACGQSTDCISKTDNRPFRCQHRSNDAGTHRELSSRARQGRRERRYLALLEAPPLPQTRAFVLNNIQNGNPFFVALAGDEVVGWCDVRRLPFPVHAHRGAFGIGILAEYRGHGLGRTLLGVTLKTAFEAGIVRIEGDVYVDNEQAIAPYDAMGFAREGIIRNAVRVDGEYRDSIMMAIRQ
jgi:RimJ/RimL family protein N-acetyltransferase